MPEIVVRAKYEDLPQRSLLVFLRATFPIWGVIFPMIFLIILGVWIYTIREYILGGTFWTDSWYAIFQAIGYSLCFMAVPAGALATIRLLSKNSLVLEKSGIIFPLETSQLLRYPRFLPWSRIRKIQAVSPDLSSDWKDRSLVFYRSDGKPTKLSLRNYQGAEVEQILVALETWGAGIDLDSSVNDLHQLLRHKQIEVAGQSYTDMWEDELRRRYNPTAFMPLDPGVYLHDGKLKIVRQLATGGLSAIYLVQMEDQKLAVLKEAVLPEDASDSVRAKASELFAREAELLTKIDHPNIVKVLSYFVEDGRNYLLMDYIPGQDLRQFTKQNGAQRETVVVDWGIQIINIVKYLHELDPPIIHRDLTPDNLVLRDDGNIILIDFGAANEFISKGTGTFVGKQSFIAPEQFRGKAVLQSDIYAFGCTLFYLLTGKEPEALECSSPKLINEQISSEIDELVQCCTQLDAKDRFQSASQLLPVLRKIAASLLGVV